MNTNKNQSAEFKKLLRSRDRLASKLEILELEIFDATKECTGSAHTNPHIDNCMLCLGVTWGRMLK